MSILYITQPSATLSKKQEAFKLVIKQEDDSWLKKNIPAQTIEQIVLIGHPSVTGEALTYALELGLSVHHLSYFGKYLGCTLPISSRNGQLRLAQYSAYCDEDKKLSIVKELVKGKIHNQYNFLYRRGEKNNPLKKYKKIVTEKSSIEQVRGIEGLAAKEYFGYWQKILPSHWHFTGRNRRPPKDEVNTLLSFAYALLQVQVTTGVNLAGLDPYIAFLHETTRGQPAMILDLMEEFRPLIADTLVFSVINRQEIKCDDFEESLGAFRLKDRGRKIFLETFEQKMNEEFKHPIFNYRCTYRRSIELQARLLARHLQENIAYKSLRLR